METSKSCPTLIVLDLDNTLYDYEKCHYVAQSALIKMLCVQLHLEISEVMEALKIARDDVKSRLGPTASSHSRLLYIEQMFLNLKLGFWPEFFLQAHQTYWGNFLSSMELRPGVEKFLMLARQKQCRIVILTDLTSEIQCRKIVRLGLGHLVDEMFTSELIGSDKIEGIGFDYVLERFESSRTWFIGDGPNDFPAEEWMRGKIATSFFRIFQIPEVGFDELRSLLDDC